MIPLLLIVVAASLVTSAAFQGSSTNRQDHVTGVARGLAEHTVTVRNETGSRIWVGSVASTDGSVPLTGLPTLDPGESAKIPIPERTDAGHWRGTIFPRQGCRGEEGTTFYCDVGDCGRFIHRCSTGEQPVSLAEFNFDTADQAAPWYDVSYVNAVSVPITITPKGTGLPKKGGECDQVGCDVDLLASCPPKDLIKHRGTGKPLYCLNPNRDAKTPYSNAIAERCPKAYAWSKQDAEAGNQVMRQCSQCSDLTVTFHGSGSSGKPKPGKPDPEKPGKPDKPKPGKPKPGKPAPDKPRPGDNGDPSHSSQKGVALNPVDGAGKALTDSGVSWFHNWTTSTGRLDKPKNVEYVPTIWGPRSVTRIELRNATRGGTHLLTFNEPDLPTQADMTVKQALGLWPRLERTGLRLGAPAVATDADKPGGWLDRFMKGSKKRGLRVDFIPVHWYGSDFSSEATSHLAGYLKRVHKRYHKPVWLTEYALIDFTKGTPRYPSMKKQTRFVQASTEMLADLDFVKRYAWNSLSTETSPTGLYDGANPNASGRAYRKAD
ncbi:glycosyl hydrolase [Streptomyces sp. WMMC500]|uniref:glycosyl hydrolase n=1 Tax=Streptomyces sp. WMMC500 TaxID=3015154 RepID=UPI00248B1F47|nr:glycosyl hydrolase [Streptomyces sp. WMMC500]WBB62063.1 glycosyl hydrolase [Streptomyces sp. WMMC500]